MPTVGLRRRGPLLTLAASCAILVVVLYLVFVGTDRGQRLDDAALDGRKGLDAQQIDNAESVLRTVDIASVAFVGVALASLAIARGRPESALAAATVIVGANLTAQGLKVVLPGPQALGATEKFFPSGHNTVAMSLALAAIIVASSRTRGVVALFGSLYAVTIGVGTLTAGWHRPSDAVAGMAIATAWAAAVAAGGSRRRTIRPRPTPVVAPLLLIGGGLLAVSAFGILVAVLAARHLGHLGAVPIRAPYLAGASLIAAAAFGLIGLFLFALRLAAPRPPQDLVNEPATAPA
jgi:membrane-associated phospholipid phosphatase